MLNRFSSQILLILFLVFSALPIWAQSGVGQVEQFQKLQEQLPVEKRFETYFEGLKKNPRDPQLHLALGNIYLERNLLELARESFKRVLILDKSLGAAHFGLSRLYRKKKLKALEVYEMEQAVATNPKNGEYRYELAVIYMEPESFDFKKAKAQYKALEKMEHPLAPKLFQYLELDK